MGMTPEEYRDLVSYLGRDGVLVRLHCDELRIVRLMKYAGLCRKAIYRERKRFERYADEHGYPWTRAKWTELRES
jgi:hypothetical protein